MARRTTLVFSVLTTLALTAVTVTPADARPAAKPRLTATGATVAEDAGSAVVKVRLSKKAKKALKVTWKASGGTATPGSDYGTAAGTVTIKKGKKAAQVVIPLLEDAADEANETFTVTVTSKKARPAKPVTVTIVDNDTAGTGGGGPTGPTAPTAPSALTGTVTVSQMVPVPFGMTTLTMNVHLVPTASPGEWRDNGTGTWSITGSLTGFSPMCIAFPTTTTVTGNGGFLTSAGTPVLGQTDLLLGGFDPAGATGTPALTWQGVGSGSTTSFTMDPMFPGICLPAGSTTANFPFALAAPGATGSYTGTTGPGRGLAFSYAAGTTTVSGTLTPVA